MVNDEILKLIAKEYNIKIKWSEYSKIVQEYIRRENTAREIRRKYADWNFIEKQPEPIKTALKILIETGDLWYAAKIAGVPLGKLNEIRRKAKIPLVVI